MYDNEFETKENKIQTKDKIEPQHIHEKAKFLVVLQPSLSLYQPLTPFFPVLFFFGHFLGFIFGDKMFPQWPNGKKLHFILNMKLLVSSFAAAQAEVKQCFPPLHLGRNVWLWPSAWQGHYKVTGLKLHFLSVSGADCDKAFKFTLH